MRLFDRNNRSVRLTDAGLRSWHPAGRRCGRSTTPGDPPGTPGTGEYGTVRIGFNAGFATDHLVSLVQVLRRDHPHLELVIDSSRRTPDIAEDAPGRRRLDIALVGGPVKGTGLEMRGSPRRGSACCSQNDDPLAGAVGAGRRSPTEHLILRRVAPGWSIRRLVEDALDRAGRHAVDVTTVADGMTMLAFVAAGIGLGFGSLNAAALTPRNLRSDPARRRPEVATSLVWKASNDATAIRTVVRAVERHLADR